MDLPPRETYVNQFDGYTTTFLVWDSRRECVIRWDNISPIEVVIPYVSELSPDMMRSSIDRLLEYVEDAPYCEFRVKVRPLTRSYENIGIFHGPVLDELYWGDEFGPKVRVISGGTTEDSQYTMREDAGYYAMRDAHEMIERNLMELLHTLRY